MVAKYLKELQEEKQEVRAGEVGSANKGLVLHELHPQTPLKKPPGTVRPLMILPLEMCQTRLTGPIWRSLHQ